jgi:hypothetical protein
MTLVPLTAAKQIRHAYSELQERLRSEGVHMKRNIGWPSGNEDLNIHWHSKHRFWSMLYPKPTLYWCGYGLQNPIEGRPLEFTVQINPPTTISNHRAAGIFLQDENGRYYLGHNGWLTKGHASLGKTAFLAQYEGTLASIQWANGSSETFAIVGRLDEPRFLRKLARFVRDVAEFKRAQSSGSGPTEAVLGKLTFRPEFCGKRKPYTPGQNIATTNTHGYVVNELRRILQHHGKPYSTGLIDLYLFGGDRMTHIFEVKTDTSRGRVYQAIGQLMLHGALEGKPPRRVIVLPDKPKQDTEERLTALGIAVLQYLWRGRTPVFQDLTDVLH